MLFTADSLAAELLNETMLAEGRGFTITKTLGILQTTRTGSGDPVPVQDVTRTEIEINAAAVRLLGERFPMLKITYPQTKLSEKSILTGQDPLIITETRTDAVIIVPEEFVQIHCGTAFQKLLQTEWAAQLDDLTAQIVKRLRRHELRTAEMFSDQALSASAAFFLTEDTAESGIWTLPISRCGFLPLQWDGEICGMALLLADRLKMLLADECGSMLEIAVRRDDAKKRCTVTLYFSLRQD
ncbi:MAG: hypothetical protein IKQ91_10670 [Oscillospiraceae bacterium]|nr:hypothetical protein [Oscillospiraceae bacterium]